MGIDLQRFKGKRSQEWLDWLEDDPVPNSMRNKIRRRSVERASRPIRRSAATPNPHQGLPAAPKAPATKVVAIHIALPNGTRLKNRFFSSARKVQSVFRQHKKLYLTGASALVIIGGGLGSYTLIKSNTSNAPVDNPDVLSENINKPTFGYSLPGGDEKSLDGEVRYNKDRKVVNYKDSIGGVTIIVSQQPLPEGFQDQTADKVKKLAEEFSATEVIATANPTAYIGTSVEGPQTVIFAKKDLLVFIKSDTKIDNHDWAEYITNLQ